MKGEMDFDNAAAMLFAAVVGMARSTASLQERLVVAAREISPIEARLEVNLPAGLLDDYANIMAALTRVPAQGSDGDVAAATRAMSNEEARRVIERIVELYDDLLRSLSAGGDTDADEE